MTQVALQPLERSGKMVRSIYIDIIIYKYIYILYIYEYIYIHTYSINDARDVWLSYPIQSKLNGKSAALI